jgi:hypothetical protein
MIKWIRAIRSKHTNQSVLTQKDITKDGFSKKSKDKMKSNAIVSTIGGTDESLTGL